MAPLSMTRRVASIVTIVPRNTIRSARSLPDWAETFDNDEWIIMTKRTVAEIRVLNIERSKPFLFRSRIGRAANVANQDSFTQSRKGAKAQSLTGPGNPVSFHRLASGACTSAKLRKT